MKHANQQFAPCVKTPVSNPSANKRFSDRENPAVGEPIGPPPRVPQDGKHETKRLGDTLSTPFELRLTHMTLLLTRLKQMGRHLPDPIDRAQLQRHASSQATSPSIRPRTVGSSFDSSVGSYGLTLKRAVGVAPVGEVCTSSRRSSMTTARWCTGLSVTPVLVIEAAVVNEEAKEPTILIRAEEAQVVLDQMWHKFRSSSCLWLSGLERRLHRRRSDQGRNDEPVMAVHSAEPKSRLSVL